MHLYLMFVFQPIDLLKNKSRPEAASEGAAAWVKSEREMRDRLKREREQQEVKDKIEVMPLYIHFFY